jgi:hypothetical protein
MPRIRRRFLLDPAEIGVYHCINRCVRRAYLCGQDPVSGKNFEHRRQWIQDRMQFLAMSFAEYLQLLDWTGRQLRQDKRGAIPAELAPILERLQVSDEGWMQLMGRFSRLFRRAAGRPQSLQREREERGCRLMQEIRHSRAIFL